MLSDDELVEQILLENENAAEELIKRYYTSILRYPDIKGKRNLRLIYTRLQIIYVLMKVGRLSFIH